MEKIGKLEPSASKAHLVADFILPPEVGGGGVAVAGNIPDWVDCVEREEDSALNGPVGGVLEFVTIDQVRLSWTSQWT